MAKDLITVALPMHNNKETIALTIKSIINQTYCNWELIIINDASSDGSEEIIEGFHDKRITLINYEKKRGVANSLNEIIDRAKGDYFARIDGDDYCYSNRFEKQLKFMKEHPSVDLIGCNLAIIDNQGNLLGKRIFNNIANNSLSNIYIPHPSFFGKISFFKKHRYKSPPYSAQDQDLLFRAYERSNYAILDEILVCYRETLNIKKIAKTRIDLIRSRFQAKKSYSQFLRLAINQLAKLTIDALAISTGLNYKILKHRCTSLTKKERADWLKLKRELNI